MILDFINDLKNVENICKLKEYTVAVKKLLQKHGYTFLGHGCYCDVYSNPKSFHVIKITKKANCKFFSLEEYSKKKDYLVPRFVSKNCFLAVQRKAYTRSYIIDKLKEIDSKANARISTIRAKSDAEKKKLNDIDKKLKIDAIHDDITDVHDANIGFIDGKVVMIDLNNQLDSI